MRVGILGLGSWGTALAARLGQAGHTVTGWTHDPAQRQALRDQRENLKYLPGIRLPELNVVETIGETVRGAEVLLFAVPSHALRAVAGDAVPHVVPGTPLVNVAKGLEETTLLRMSELLEQILSKENGTAAAAGSAPTAAGSGSAGSGSGPASPIVSLLGPSHAEEVSQNHPTALVAASQNARAALAVQELMNGETLRVYTSPDLVGVELAAALKNIIAIAAGISTGVGYGDNTFGALLTRGLAEITRLGTALGGRPETFYGLSGLGDLVTTCISGHSRNRRVGYEIGRGQSPASVLGGMTMVAEGVRTTRAARALAARHGIEMPITEQVHEVLFAGKDPRAAIGALMIREPKAELV